MDLSPTFTIDNLLRTPHPPSLSGQRDLQEHVEEEDQEAEFLDYYYNDLRINEREIMVRQQLRDLVGRQGSHRGGAGEEGAIFGPASAAAVAGLEKQAFHSTAEGCGVGAITGCAICLENFEDGEEVTVMPCSRVHEFHPGCITTWLGKSNTCPLCRRALPTDVMDVDDL